MSNSRRLKRIPCPHDGPLWPVVTVVTVDGTEGVNVVVCRKCGQAIGVDQLPPGDLEEIDDGPLLRVVPTAGTNV